jgi:hypothetical protein
MSLLTATGSVTRPDYPVDAGAYRR